MKQNMNEIINSETQLFSNIKVLIDSAKEKVAQEVNTTMSALCWEIGRCINQDLLKNQWTDYDPQTIKVLSQKLQDEYGSSSFSEKNLRCMMQFAQIFPDYQIVVSVIRQFSWTHIIAFLPMDDELKRTFYMEMCRLKKWSLSLRDRYSETDLENAILDEMEKFICELGTDFGFLARQKRITVDKIIEILTFAKEHNSLVEFWF